MWSKMMGEMSRLSSERWKDQLDHQGIYMKKWSVASTKDRRKEFNIYITPFPDASMLS